MTSPQVLPTLLLTIRSCCQMTLLLKGTRCTASASLSSRCQCPAARGGDVCNHLLCGNLLLIEQSLPPTAPSCSLFPSVTLMLSFVTYGILLLRAMSVSNRKTAVGVISIGWPGVDHPHNPLRWDPSLISKIENTQFKEG